MFNIRKRRSISNIIASFNRIIADLEALQDHHHANHVEITARIAALQTERDNIIAENRQAETIAANLNSLLGYAA